MDDSMGGDEHMDISTQDPVASVSIRQTSGYKVCDEKCSHELIHSDTSNVVVIDDEGDLYIELSDGKLKVSRKVMTLSSPVFLAMLGTRSKFAEAKGKSRTFNGLQVVAFLDDNLSEMIIVARIIHLQHSQVPRSLAFQQLYQMAVLCDKYDLRHCLGLWPKQWTKPWLQSYSVKGYEGCLVIAKAFQLSGLYKATTRHFILNALYDERSGGIVIDNPDVSDHVSPNVLSQYSLCRFMEV